MIQNSVRAPHSLWALVGVLTLAACSSAVPEPGVGTLQPAATSYTVTELSGFSDSTTLYPRELDADGSVIVGSAYSSSNTDYRAVQWNAAGEVTALGTLGGRDSGASAVSAEGTLMAGRSWSPTVYGNAVRWNAAGAVTELGTLGGEFDRDEADLISADGSVVAGTAYNNLITKERAVRWNAAGQITPLASLGGPVSRPRAISRDGGVIVGYAEPAGVGEWEGHAVKWNSAGQVTDLGTLGGVYSDAYAVSADGSVVVGNAELASGLARAARWNGAGQIMALANLGGRYSSANAITADGSVVVGYAQNSANQNRAVKWNAAGQITDLGTLPGGASSIADDISADGSVVLGRSQNSAGRYRAVVWNAAGQITDLPTLGGENSSPTALSADGRVAIGTAQNAAGVYRAVVWRAVTTTRQNQTLTFTTAAPVSATVGGTSTVSATASSGLAVSFSSTTTSICTVSGSTVRFVAAGTCTVQASQVGNASYNPAPSVSQTFTVRAATTPATYTADLTTAPLGRILSSVRLGGGLSSPTGRAVGTVGLYARRKDKTGNVAMSASSARHLIISKDGVAQTSYSLGGYLEFKFATFGSGVVTVKTLQVKSTTSTGGTVKLYRGSTLLKTVSVPKTGAGVTQTLTLNVANATLVRVTLTGAGAVDNLVVTQ